MTATAEPDVISFGPTEVPDYKRVPIDFRYFRDETIESQRFQVVVKTMDIGAANRVMRLVSSSGDSVPADGQAFISMMSMISKFMDNADGTPANWEPVPLPRKKNEPEGAPLRFRAPDGRIHPMDKAPDFLAHGAGSSRRRWLHLINEDEDATVELEALTKLLEFLMELAGKGRGRA